jgi:hypothetical protein
MAQGTALPLTCLVGRFDYAEELVTSGARIRESSFGSPTKYRNYVSIGVRGNQLSAIYPPNYAGSQVAAADFAKRIISFEAVIDIKPVSLGRLTSKNSHNVTPGTPVDLLMDAMLSSVLPLRSGEVTAARILLQPDVAFRAPRLTLLTKHCHISTPCSNSCSDQRKVLQITLCSSSPTRTWSGSDSWAGLVPRLGAITAFFQQIMCEVVLFLNRSLC